MAKRAGGQTGTADAVSATVGTRLLPRVRTLFRQLTFLMLVVEVLEWLDSTSPVWPDRAIAAVALASVIGWALALPRSGPVSRWLDLWIVGAVVVAGWGLGRSGAVLALLLGVTLLRSLYGDRRSVAVAHLSLVGGYVLIGFLHKGMDGVLDLGVVTVAVALLFFGGVTRMLSEVLAGHDLSVAWNDQLGRGAARLVACNEAHEVDAVVDDVVADLRAVTPGAGGGVVRPPQVPAISLGTAVAVTVDGDADPGAVRELSAGLERLLNDARLTRERIDVETRYRRLAEGSRDGIYLRQLGVETELVYLNEAAAALLPTLVIDRTGPVAVNVEMVHADDRDRVQASLGSVGYFAEPIRLRVPTESGEERWVEVEEVPASIGEHGVELVQGTVRDVSRQLRHEEALTTALAQEQRATERLRQVDELRTTFLAAVSHELRTPLAGLLGSAHTLVRHRDRLSGDQAAALAGAVERQGQRLKRLLDDLLDVERLSQGLIVPEREPTPILELVRGVVEEQLERSAVSVDETSEAVTLDVDRSQVERIIDNLIRNAVKHTPEGTTINVGVRARTDGVVITVADDGPGIPPPLREALFEPFAQGPDAARAASPGTGIGLSLVRRFAELHGGRAWIEESPAGGARFHVFLSGSLTEAERSRGAVARDGAR